MSLRQIYIYLIYIVSLCGALFTYIKLGPFSLSALFTFSATFIPLFFMRYVNKETLIIALPFILYCFYDLMDFIGGHQTLSTIQDASVWTGMLFILIISSNYKIDLSIHISKIMEYSKYIFLIYVFYFFIKEIDSPATMMISVLYFSYFLSKFITKTITILEIYILILLFLVPIAIGSRIIYLSELIIFFIMFLKYYGEKKSIQVKLKKILLLIISFFIVMGIAFILKDKIENVMTKGDGAKVGNIAINTSGRAYMWEVVYNSAKEKLVFGHGVDGPPSMLSNPQWAHPHNDYLRLLHHNGLVGLFLWLSFFLTLVIILLKRIKLTNSITNKKFYLFNLSFLIAIFILMATDNPIVYSYVMYPLMIITGISLNLKNFEQREN